MMQASSAAADTPLLAARGGGRFLSEMMAINTRPLYSLSEEWHVLPQTLVPLPPSPPAASAPPGALRLPAAAAFDFATRGLEIEGNPDRSSTVSRFVPF